MFVEVGQVLVIIEVKEDDGDKYFCEVLNLEGIFKQSIEFYVELGMGVNVIELLLF